MNIPINKKLLRFLALFTASGGGAGYFPFASGTVGSLVAAYFVWISRGISTGVLIGISVALLVIGVWAAGQTCQILKKKDASQIVMDEIVGMLITMIGIPVTPYWLLIGFFLFRLLDIVKPSPAKYFDEKVPGGWGVMMDDVIAGIYGNMILQLMLRAKM